MARFLRARAAVATIVLATLAVTSVSAAAGPKAGASGSGLSSDPVLRSAAAGAVVGSVGGPIGMVIGAGVGILHGLWTKQREEQQTRAETERQRALDLELEREMARQRPRGGSIVADQDGQGVLIVKDHLAEAPGAPLVSAGAGNPASVAAHAQDADGFVPVFERDRLVRQERRAADGRVEVVLHYDTRGRIVRRDESSRLDGHLDTSSSYVDGILQGRESDTDGDGIPDVWAYYDARGELSRLESRGPDGARRAESYRGGRVVERLEGDLLSVFDDAGRLLKQGHQGTGGRVLAWRHFEPDGNVAREEELDEDGALVAVAHYDGGRLVRRELYEIDESAFRRVPLVSAEPAPR